MQAVQDTYVASLLIVFRIVCHGSLTVRGIFVIKCLIIKFLITFCKCTDLQDEERKKEKGVKLKIFCFVTILIVTIYFLL